MFLILILLILWEWLGDWIKKKTKLDYMMTVYSGKELGSLLQHSGCPPFWQRQRWSRWSTWQVLLLVASTVFQANSMHLKIWIYVRLVECFIFLKIFYCYYDACYWRKLFKNHDK